MYQQVMSWTTPLFNSIKLWAMPCTASENGRVMVEFWENVVHWKREWQTTSISLPWKPHEQSEKAKREDTERWTPKVDRWPICYWRSVGNNSRKNEETEPKKKQHPVVDGTGDRSKVQCCKEQYCIGNWNVRSMNQAKLEWSNRRWQEWTSTF